MRYLTRYKRFMGVFYLVLKMRGAYRKNRLPTSIYQKLFDSIFTHYFLITL